MDQTIEANAGKETQRRRVSVLLLALLAISLFETFALEGTKLVQIADDIIALAITLVAIGAFVMTRKDDSFAKLRRANNVALVVAAVLVFLAFLAIAVTEVGDADALGDDFPKLFLGIFLLVNRFV
jgi:hypothetical protein